MVGKHRGCGQQHARAGWQLNKHTKEQRHWGSAYSERHGQRSVRWSPSGNSWRISVIVFLLRCVMAKRKHEIRVSIDLEFMQVEKVKKYITWTHSRASVVPRFLVSVFFWWTFDFIILLHPPYFAWAYILWCNNTITFQWDLKNQNLGTAVLELLPAFAVK